MPASIDRTRPQRSLSSHHLFAPIVALWFGALFGLSALAVRTSLFEQLVLASGFDLLVPAAAPPLGHFARLLIAGALGLAGASLGYALAFHYARQLRDKQHHRPEQPRAEAYRVRTRDAHPDAPARRPLSVHEELGTPPLDSAFPQWEHDAPDEDAGESPEMADLTLPDWLTGKPADANLEVDSPAAVEMPPMEDPSAPAGADPAYPAAWRNTADRIARAHPSSLSQVELLERLAMALGDSEAPLGSHRPSEVSAGMLGPDAESTIKALRNALSSLPGG